MEDWLDTGQARDIFLPAFNYRPLKSVQYGLAIGNFTDPTAPLRYTWGFISSSDNHSSRPGTGFKQYDRRPATEAFGERSAYWRELLFGKKHYPAARSATLESLPLGVGTAEFERQASFWTLGGLVAVHATGRNREAIWAALKRKEVYGASGDVCRTIAGPQTRPAREGYLRVEWQFACPAGAPVMIVNNAFLPLPRRTCTTRGCALETIRPLSIFLPTANASG